MKKKKSDWFQKINPKKIREIIGKITEKDIWQERYIAKYTIVEEQSKEEYYCAIQEHDSSPKLEDKVKIYTQKGETLVYQYGPYQRKRPDGSIEIIDMEKNWEPIIRYKILKE